MRLMEWNHKQSIKEIMRHVAFKLGADQVLLKHRKQRGFIVEHLNGATTSERFSDAYRLGAWVHSANQASLSGLGSEAAATRGLGNALSELLKRRSCRMLLDVGCGDWNWMHGVDLPCEYIGVDIVPDIIEFNRSRYERAGVRFAVADAITELLPKADVALCREVLFHLSFRDGLAVLGNIRKAAPWLLATSDSANWFNAEIRTGDYRKINLSRSPYRLVNMQECIMDDAVSSGRLLGLWRTADLP